MVKTYARHLHSRVYASRWYKMNSFREEIVWCTYTIKSGNGLWNIGEEVRRYASQTPIFNL